MKKTQSKQFRQNKQNNRNRKTSKLKELDHTADIGLEISACNNKELFCLAAQGMFGHIGVCKNFPSAAEKTLSIEITAKDLELLLVDWLGQLLTLSDIYSLFFYQFQVQTLSERHIKAKIFGIDINSKNIERKTQIKAVTYHQLKIRKLKQQIKAMVFFDI